MRLHNVVTDLVPELQQSGLVIVHLKEGVGHGEELDVGIGLVIQPELDFFINLR